MSYTNGIGNTQNPFAAETAATSGVSQTERAASVSLSNPVTSGVPLSSGADHTKLSEFGGALAQVLSTTSDVRMDKVTALQQAIVAGTYNVSASDVADKMIQSLLV